MKILLNADDFGYSDDTVAATIECFESGALTSATIMPNMPATAKAVEYACAHPELSFGIHLTFAGDGTERPMLDPARIPDLVLPSGAFRGGGEVMSRGTLRHIDVRQVQAEMDAQIRSLLDKGVRLSHVDSHGHIHKAWPFVQAMRALLPGFGLGRVRRGQNVWFRTPYKSPTFWTGGILHPRIDRYFRTTDRFFMPNRLEDAARMTSLLARRPPGTLEVGVHPGYAEDWRDAERRGVQAFAAAVRAGGFALSSWNAL